MVWLKGFWRWHNVSLLMLQSGFATIYTGQQAAYGDMYKIFQSAEATAKQKKVGMWKQKRSSYVSPMEFKKAARDKEAAS